MLDYTWMAGRYPPESRPELRLGRLAFDAPLSYTLKQDQQWVLTALSDQAAPVEFRSMLLRLAVHLAPMKDGSWRGCLPSSGQSLARRRSSSN